MVSLSRSASRGNAFWLAGTERPSGAVATIRAFEYNSQHTCLQLSKLAFTFLQILH